MQTAFQLKHPVYKKKYGKEDKKVTKRNKILQ